MQSEAIPRMPGFRLRFAKVGSGSDPVMYQSYIDWPDRSRSVGFDFLIAPGEALWYLRGYLAAEAAHV